MTFDGSLPMPGISRRAASLGTENAFVVLAEVNALARTGKDIISFCIGQPDFPAPENVQEAAIRAIKGGKHGYTPSAGIDELREAAANGARLIVFPECALSGYCYESKEEAWPHSEALPGLSTEILTGDCRRQNVDTGLG